MTRAIASCIQCDFGAAIVYNPRVIIVLPLIAWVVFKKVRDDIAILCSIVKINKYMV